MAREKNDLTARRPGVVLAVNTVERLPLDKIRQDGGTQMRAGLREETVEEYREKMEATNGWGDFPTVQVVYDGSAYWLTDGFHRLAAALRAFGPGCLIPVEVLAGDREAAIMLAAKANATHGLRRSNADKRRAVQNVLALVRLQGEGDAKIADICAVSARFVGAVRDELQKQGILQPTTHRQGRDGRVINTEKIGRPPSPKGQLPPWPATIERREQTEADAQQIAQATAVVAAPAPTPVVVVQAATPTAVALLPQGPVVTHSNVVISNEEVGRPGELLTPILRRDACRGLYEMLTSGAARNFLTPEAVESSIKAFGKVMNQGVRT